MAVKPTPDEQLGMTPHTQPVRLVEVLVTHDLMQVWMQAIAVPANTVAGDV